MIDLHSHLLPGVDDGARDFDESLELLRGLASQNITDVVLTPHYINGTAQTSPVFKNVELYNLLRAKAIRENIPVKLHLGNEIYIDRDIEKLIRYGKLKPLGKSKYLLIELPMSGEYSDYEGIFMDLLQDGYKVILAHPERYHTAQKDYNILLELHAMGVLFQCNLGSFVDQYGKDARKTAVKLAKDGLIFAFGTDLHHPRDYSEFSEAVSRLKKFYSDDELDQLLNQNPKFIFQTEF